MTLAAALTTPINDLATPDLWEAVKAIGSHKLAMRQMIGTRKALGRVGPLNARIDALNQEEDARKRSGRR